MHFKSILHVRDHSKATGTSHHLLQTIANHVNMHTGEAFGPSVDRLAVRLNVTPQWVRQLRSRLVAEGELIFRQSRGRHPNVYIIPFERCPLCQGLNPKVQLPDEINPDETNPQVDISEPATQPETATVPTRKSQHPNPKVRVVQPESHQAATRNSDSPNPQLNPKVWRPQPETLTPPTRNCEGANPKVGEPFEAVLKRIKLRKDLLKEEKEKKEGATRNCLEPWLEDKPERQSPFWCEAHGFCHGERLSDHRPDCTRER